MTDPKPDKHASSVEPVRVAAGDTWAIIAGRVKVDADKLAEANGGVNAPLVVGRSVVLP